VNSIDAVDSVTTDMNANTVTVSFDDDAVSLGDIVDALSQAGYSVTDSQQTPATGAES